MPKLVRAAVVQAASVVFDPASTLTRAIELTRKAAAQGAELVVFPEAFLGSYPKGLDFGASVGGRTREGREDYRRYFEGAIDVPGHEVQEIANLTRELHLHLVIGVIERGGATLYCTVLFFGPNGYLGKHRKLMPTASERLVWGFGDGSTLPVFETGLGRLGAVICWENYMPLMRMAMYAKGIELYCAPTADNRPTWVPSMQHVALEGRCFVLSACQHMRRRDCPDSYDVVQGNDPDTLLMRGGSCIISPLGEIIAGPVWDEDAILVADLDMGEIGRGKYDFDVAGHYARPDIFHLQVNEAPMPAVSTVRGALAVDDTQRVGS